MNIRLMALSSIIVVGCTGDPLALTPEDISFSVASAACQRIEFDASMALGATGFAGTVTGDLEGTIRVVFTQPAIAHGVANLNDGTDFIDVTGGSFPDLIGTTVEHRHDNMFVLAPGLGAVGRLNGQDR